MFMITIVHFKRAYVTWKGQARFVRLVDYLNTSNIKSSKIRVLLELSSRKLYFEEIQSTIDNHKYKLKNPLHFFL